MSENRGYLDLNKLIMSFAKSTDTNLPLQISEAVSNAKEIRRRLQLAYNQLDNAKHVYEEAENKCVLDVAEIRKSCTHPTTTYFPDPSGNNDSYTQCDVCGVET